MHISLRPEPFDPWEEIRSFQENHVAHTGKFGATACFVGTMRDFNEYSQVSSMELEYYPGMTELQIEAIVRKAKERWSVLEVLVIHRVGEITPQQAIVVIAVWAAHRGSACDAARHILEELKSSAPFWKNERLADNRSRWVQSNTSGY